MISKAFLWIRNASKLRKVLLAFGCLFLIGLGWIVVRVFMNQWSHDQLVLSLETTVISSPLDELGYPDYLAALNERMNESVTAENNAAVLLLQAVGPAAIPLEIRAAWFESLNASPLPDEGDYFEPWITYATRVFEAEHAGDLSSIDNDAERRFEDQYDEALDAPWTRVEYPHVAKWLDANEQKLEIVIAASERSRFYSPLVRHYDSDSLLDVQTPLLLSLREMAEALGIRAMLRLGERDLEGAWGDLIACRRLGHLAAEGPMVVDALVGLGIDGIAFAGELQLVADKKLTVEQCDRWRRELEELPPMPKMVEKIDLGERFVLLGAICKSAKYGPETLHQENIVAAKETSITPTLIDWNVPLRLANQWMDRLVAAASVEGAAEQSAARAVFNRDLRAMGSSIIEPKSMIKAFLSRRTASEKVGQIMVDLMLPALEMALTAESGHRTQQTLTRLALAIAVYRSDHSEFPASLSELQPKYIDTIPTDAFAARPFIYRRTQDGYVLYSVGENGVDEEGKNTMYDEEGDDWQVQVPAKVRSKASVTESEPHSPHAIDSLK